MAQALNKDSIQQLRRELVARFSRPLATFFHRRIKDRSLAEEMMQEVLLRVVHASEKGGTERADSHVFKVATSLLRDYSRRTQRTGSSVFLRPDDDVDGRLGAQLAEAVSPERLLHREESLADLLRSLEELGELTRNIFILFRLENMQQKDIAALYGIRQSRVEKHVIKAVLHLARRHAAWKQGPDPWMLFAEQAKAPEVIEHRWLALAHAHEAARGKWVRARRFWGAHRLGVSLFLVALVLGTLLVMLV